VHSEPEITDTFRDKKEKPTLWGNFIKFATCNLRKFLKKGKRLYMYIHNDSYRYTGNLDTCFPRVGR
jgi:hypothetical protein